MWRDDVIWADLGAQFEAKSIYIAKHSCDIKECMGKF